MECVWVAESDAIERLIAGFADLTAGKIEAQYHLAVNSGNVRLCALILGERLTEWRRVTVTDDLSRAIDLRVEWNDLIVQVRQQLGKNAMALAPHTVLLISREDAEQRMRQRIDLAKTVLPGDRWFSDELHAGEERERAWRVYNRELLARIFSTDEFAREYDLAAVPIHQTSDRYFDVDSNTIAGRVLGSVRKQVARLESIIDRLELIEEGTVQVPSPLDKSKVFVVHGHDDGAREGIARFLEKIGLEAVILKEQPNRGRTIIEKFVDYAREVGFAVVLLTPDDLGAAAADEAQKSRAAERDF